MWHKNQIYIFGILQAYEINFKNKKLVLEFILKTFFVVALRFHHNQYPKF